MASIQYKKDWIIRTLTWSETHGVRSWQEMDRVCDTICWLWKWKHITDEEKDEFCDRATAILESRFH